MAAYLSVWLFSGALKLAAGWPMYVLLGALKGADIILVGCPHNVNEVLSFLLTCVVLFWVKLIVRNNASFAVKDL